MKYFNKTNLSLTIVVLFSYVSMFNGSGSHSWNGGRTNAPFDNGTCSGSGCHTPAGSFNPSTTLTLLSGTTPVTTYNSNTNYTLRITITSTGTGSNTRYGFQAVSVKSGSPYTAINNWGTMPSGTKKTTVINGRTYASHSTSNLATNTINIPWTSPATSTGNITFYAAGLVSNRNFNRSGDNVATTQLTITPAASGCSTPTLTPTITHVDCFDGQTGAISVNAVGGTTPISYDWSGPGGYSASTKDITNIKASQYRLIVTANGGCKDTINPVVNQPQQLTANITSNTPYCAGDNISLSVAASGGNSSSYTYAWEGPKGALGAGQIVNVNSAGASDTGDYMVTVTDAKNCIVKDTANIQIDSLPIADAIKVDTISQNTYSFSIVNPRYVDNVSWQFGDGKTATSHSAQNTYTSNNTYNISLIISNHCGSDTLKTTQNVWPQSIKYHSQSTNLKIYPNPADKIITIVNNGDTEIQQIRLLSLTGTVVYKAHITNQATFHISTNNYANGVYVIQIISENNSYGYIINIGH